MLLGVECRPLFRRTFFHFEPRPVLWRFCIPVANLYNRWRDDNCYTFQRDIRLSRYTIPGLGKWLRYLTEYLLCSLDNNAKQLRLDTKVLKILSWASLFTTGKRMTVVSPFNGTLDYPAPLSLTIIPPCQRSEGFGKWYWISAVFFRHSCGLIQWYQRYFHGPIYVAIKNPKYSSTGH